MLCGSGPGSTGSAAATTSGAGAGPAPPPIQGARAMTRMATLAYLGCSLSIGVFAAFNNFTLSLWLATFTTSYFLIAMLGNTRSFEGALISPVFGAWSDRSWAGWLGRRRAFIL